MATNKNNGKRRPLPRASEQDAQNIRGNSLLNRRDFLATAGAILAGTAAATALITSKPDSLPTDRPSKKEPLPPVDRPTYAMVLQDEVDAMYRSAYNTLSKAKKDAEADGKNLVVLCGDLHDSSNSFLQATILTDVARRLGVTRSLLEIDAETLSSVQKETEDIIAENLDKFGLAQDGAVASRGIKKEEARTMLLLSSLVSNLKNVEHKELYTPGEQDSGTYGYFDPLISRALGNKIIACDPNRLKRLELGKAGDISTAISGKLEESMIKATLDAAHEGHAIGIFGAVHIPALHRALEENNVKVVSFNCAADLAPHLRQTPLYPEDELLLQRYKELNEMAEMELMGTKYAHPHPATALAMAVRASARHRAYMNEFSETEKTAVERWTKVLEPPAPSHGVGI